MLAPYRKLEVWQLAHALSQQIYKTTAKFSPSERYGLVSQLRRAAVSVPTNIVEGNARGGKREYGYYCNVARASAIETMYLLELSVDLGMLSREDFAPLAEDYDRVAAMLHALAGKLGHSRGW